MTAEGLKEANAAVALGDWAVPPRGTLVAFADEPPYAMWRVIGVRHRRFYVSVDVQRDDTDTYGRFVTSYHVGPGSETKTPRIVSVPDWAPPFDEWERFR